MLRSVCHLGFDYRRQYPENDDYDQDLDKRKCRSLPERCSLSHGAPHETSPFIGSARTCPIVLIGVMDRWIQQLGNCGGSDSPHPAHMRRSYRSASTTADGQAGRLSSTWRLSSPDRLSSPVRWSEPSKDTSPFLRSASRLSFTERLALPLRRSITFSGSESGSMINLCTSVFSMGRRRAMRCPAGPEVCTSVFIRGLH